MPQKTEFNSKIAAFLGKIDGIKKAATPLTEVGGQGDASTHPSATEDDNTQSPVKGDRATEYEQDMKEQHPMVDAGIPDAKLASAVSKLAKKAGALPAFLANSLKDETKKPDTNKPGTEKAKAGPTKGTLPPQFKKSEAPASQPGSAEDDQVGNLKVAPTGEDPAHETSSAMSKKQDPGSDHPARVDNDELDGRKFANWSFAKTASMQVELGNRLTADIAVQMSAAEKQIKQAQAVAAANPKPTQKTAKQVAAQQVAVQTLSPETSKRAGWEFSALLGGTLKQAEADAWVELTIREHIKTAQEDAENIYWFTKLAEEDPAAMEAMLAGAGGGGGEMGGAMGGAEGGGGEMPPPPVDAMTAPAPGGGHPGAEGGAGGMDLAGIEDMLASMGLHIVPIEGGAGGGEGAPPPEPAAAPAPTEAPPETEEEEAPTPESNKEASDKSKAKAGTNPKTAAAKSKNTLNEFLQRAAR